MIHISDLQSVCSQLRFHDWRLRCGVDTETFWLQWQWLAPCAETGKEEVQGGRKWRVSRHATVDEIVKTAFAGILFALEHEARETFTYKGKPIFHPHTDVEELLRIADAPKARRTTGI